MEIEEYFRNRKAKKLSTPEEHYSEYGELPYIGDSRQNWQSFDTTNPERDGNINLGVLMHQSGIRCKCGYITPKNFSTQNKHRCEKCGELLY